MVFSDRLPIAGERIVTITDEALLAEFRGRTCEFCKKQRGVPHHARAKGIGGGARLDHRYNIAVACVWCHSKIHAGQISFDEVLAVIAKREGREPDDIRCEIWRLLREPKP